MNGRRAAGKVREQQMLDNAIVIDSLKRGFSRLGREDRSAGHHRRGGVALDPGAEVGGRVLMPIRIGLPELMMELKCRNEWRKSD